MTEDPEDARTIAERVSPGVTAGPLPKRTPGESLNALMAVHPAPADHVFHVRVPRALSEDDVTALFDAGIPRACVALDTHSALIRASVSATSRSDAIAALMPRIRAVLGPGVILEDHIDS
jgi:hypothetical protein